MSRITFTLTLATICAGTVLASAQTSPRPTEVSSSSSPVAYVYVSASPRTGKYRIRGYSAASGGSLTAIAGSPFSANASYGMAVNAKWMFETDGWNLFSLKITSSGALKPVSEVVGDGQTLLGSLSLDHTGSTLYVGTNRGSGDQGYEYFAINNSTGELSFLGATEGANPDFGQTPLAFIANNLYAYSSNCALLDPYIFGFLRNDDGTLNQLNINPPMPTGADYCPWKAAPDAASDVAIPVWPVSGGPWQLAVYTADGSGNLTTNSTISNMPDVLVGSVEDVSASPSGRYLAVGGSSGLQLFHYNGANPLTKFTGALVSKEIDQVFWDNSHHLYAISRKANKLYVFTVSAKSATQAPGSPHDVAGTEFLIVLPK